MKAVLINELDRSLYMGEIDKPLIKENEILIKIYAAGINRADILQKKGTYPSPVGWPDRMGLEVSGRIEEIGSLAKEKTNYNINDRVCALLGGGGYAEYIAVPYEMVMPMPKNLSFVEAAGLPEVYATSYLNLFWEGKLNKEDTVYVAAGTSGIASIAIPMAKAWGCKVITSVKDTDCVAQITHLNADIVVDLSKESLSEKFKELSDEGKPVKVAMDCLGGEYIGECFPYLHEGAYWVLISTLAGTETNIPLRALLTKGIHLVGSMLRKRSSEEKGVILNSLVKDIWPLIENNEIKPVVYKTLKLEEADEGQKLLEDGVSVGKVILEVRDENSD